MTTQSSVRIGDYICLYCEEIEGFVYNDDTSIKNNGLKVYSGQTYDNVQQLPNIHAVTFEILAANRYKLSKHYKKLQQRLKDEGKVVPLQHEKKAAAAEAKDNESEQQRLLGNPIIYGDIIQLRHVLTRKFVHVSTKEASKVDNNKLHVGLAEANAKEAQFRIQPRYKVKGEGEQLEVEDLMTLESIKSPGSFLHLSTKKVTHDRVISEINCGPDATVFQVYRHYTPNEEQDGKVIRGGSAVQLFHKDIEGYISAEGMFDEEIIVDAHLRYRPMVPSDIDSYFPPKNANTIWQLILEESAIAGEMVKWETAFHIQHMTSRYYLSFSEEGQATLMGESSEDTLFQFQPLLHDSSAIHVNFERTVRLYHIKTKGWVNSSLEMIFQRNQVGTEGSLESIEWDKAKLLQLRVSSKRQYPDAFVLKKVDPDTTKNFNYVGGLFPFLKEIIQKTNEDELQEYTGKDIMKINETFEELKRFLADEPKETGHSRKDMLRQTKLADLLIHILGLTEASKNKFMLDVFRQIYEVIYSLASSRTAENLLYCGRFLSFFQTQMLLPRNVGVQSCLTVIELIKDNRKVLDRVQPAQIIAFMNLLIKHQKHQFLDLLGILCVCQGVAMTEHQKLISEYMFVENKKYIYQLESGKDEKTAQNRIFISTDNGYNWVSLEKFTNKKSGSYSEEKNQYLMKQLELYKHLCYGGNEKCLELVIQNKGVFKWEVVLLALEDKTLPDGLRTQMCSVVTDIFLESGRSTSVLENVTNNFVYRDVFIERAPSKTLPVLGLCFSNIKEKGYIDEQFPGLMEWLTEFLKSNTKLQPKKPTKCLLISQVIRLISSLIKYGLVYESTDLDYFKNHIMRYIRKDKDKEEIDEKEGQIPEPKPKQDTDGILETKLKCADFVDIMITMQFTRKMKHLIIAFKDAMRKKEKDGSLFSRSKSRSNLYGLMSDKLKPPQIWNHVMNKQIVQLFEDLHHKSDFFGPEIVNTLFNMATQGNDTIRRKAFHLMNKYFSYNPTFVSIAERAKLLLNTDSEQVHLETTLLMPTLRRFANSKISEDELATITGILDSLLGFCDVQDRNDESRNVRQDILVNNGILDVLLKMVLQDHDKGLKSMHKITETVTRKGLVLLQSLAYHNQFVQDWIYGHLEEFLYEIHIAGSELALMLMEMFKGNPTMCGKMEAKHIQQIVRLVGKNKEEAPEFLNLLSVLAKDEESGTVNTRHQLEIIKSVMARFSTVGFPMTKPKSQRMETLKGQNGKQLRSYHVNLVGLLATCCEGTNAYIESACQKFLSVGEILRVLVNPDINLLDRIPFAKFFVRVYLNTSKSKLETGTSELSHDAWIWKFINLIKTLLSDVASQQITEETSSNDEVQFMWDAGFHVMQSFLGKFYSVDLDEHADEQEKLIQLEYSMEAFCEAYADHISSTKQLDLLSECLLLIRYSIGNEAEPNKTYCPPGCIPALLKHKLHEKTYVTKTIEKSRERLTKKTLKKKDTFYDEEIEVNHKFHMFCTNLQCFIKGQDTVAFVCGRSESWLQRKQYYPADVPLPNGLDFQEFVNFFCDAPNKDPKVQYKKVTEIIEQLRVSHGLWRREVPPEQEALDIKCVQVLRALLYNHIVGLQDNWNSGTSSKEEQGKIKKIQSTLDNFGIIRKVLPLMGRTNPEFGQQILQLLDLLLFDANIDIQSSVYKYFKSTKEEAFFFVIKEALEHAAPRIKEMRYIEAKKEADFLERRKTKAVAHAVDDSRHEALLLNITKDLDMILRVISGLCDGQNRTMQNYFRFQPDNLKSVNVVAKMTEFISVIYSSITTNTIELCARLFSSLHELCEGNKANCLTLLNHKIIDYINLLLRKLDFGSCTMDQVIEFRAEIGGLLYSLIEEYGTSDSANTAHSVCQTVSVENVRHVMTLCYAVSRYNIGMKVFVEGCTVEELEQMCSKMKNDKGKAMTGQMLKLEELGFFYYVILETINDIEHRSEKEGVKLTKRSTFDFDLQKKAFSHYQKQSSSVELIKDDQIQKKHFRVDNMDLLRDEVIEEVKYGVDRSSPSSKLRDLMFYSEDILKDIEYQKTLYQNPYGSYLAKHWMIWNYFCIFLSLVINVFMLSTWDAPFSVSMLPSNATSLFENNCLKCEKPKIDVITESQYYIILYVLGAVHTFCSVMLFGCYLLLYHPSLPDVKRTFSREKSSKRKSNLEVKLFSSTTLYYLVSIVFSVLGTVYYGYFFAFHFFGIIDNNQLLKGVIKSVTLNGRSLIWVAILGVIILYIYTLFAFAFYRSDLNVDDEVFCRSLSECFVTLIRYGTIGDFAGGYMHLNPLNHTFKQFGYLTVFHVSFFIIFTTILMNIIFGIIVDTFSQIRDTKWVAEKDMIDSCYICGKDSHEFEHYAKGFSHHVRKEHNMWAYVFYFIYLYEKDDKDYTALDMHVSNLFKDNDMSFFPMNRALSLTQSQEYTVEDQVSDVKTTLQDMQTIQQKQGKLLVNIMERMEYYENQPAPVNPTDPSTGTASLSVGSGSTRLRPLNLNRQADQWRRSARIAEQTERLSILTASKKPTGRRMSTSSSIASFLHAADRRSSDSSSDKEHGIDLVPIDVSKMDNIPKSPDKDKKEIPLQVDIDDLPTEEMQFVAEQDLDNDMIYIEPRIDEEEEYSDEDGDNHSGETVPVNSNQSLTQDGECDTISQKSSEKSEEENDTYL